jgi:hypothetical protein
MSAPGHFECVALRRDDPRRRVIKSEATLFRHGKRHGVARLPRCRMGHRENLHPDVIIGHAHGGDEYNSRTLLAAFLTACRSLVRPEIRIAKNAARRRRSAAAYALLVASFASSGRK